ncbi:MAG: alpha-amylase, partial [Calditrichaeota bacterium]|nr:alpha-amylase [Calditrichota bacterium]
MTLPLFTVHHLHGKAPRTADQPGVFREMEFHVSRKARDRYQFDLSLFTTNGRVIFANPYAARLFSQKINDARDLISQPDSAASAADITAMGLIDEILHSVIARYRQEVNPRVFQEAITYLQQEISLPELETTLQQFVNDFPPLQVYTGQKTVLQYLAGSSNGVSHREMALEEMLLLWFSNNNPAFAKYRELFDDQELRQNTAYPRIMTGMRSFFDTQPPLPGLAGPGNLIDFLSLPFLSVPGSLVDQLRFIRENWGTYLRPELGISWEALLSSDFMERWGVPNPDFETRTLRSIDFYEEEHKMRFNPGMGPAPTEVPFFGYVHHEEEPEQFSEDLHWMPQLVLVAKSTLVWLDQLSKTYGKEIRQLDQIPIEEIKELAARGFTGIWLIGIWQRSKASRKLKQWCGNPEAESSAYSLYEYRIAEELGGDEAYAVFKERCASVGVRVGSDMVPNHTGIESRWMEEHPDWFVQSPYPPFPSYKFDSGNLSEHPHVAIHLEDHYYNRTDASVVFKRVDKRTGDVRYVYHGNDGTSMPWNDTAQLNYLLPQVREAVIQTIIRVAKQFPIIRFDAAMTLAKKHYHRLWFPQPGSGGDIPSRAEHGLTREQFDQLMPVEFWREVVDRIAEEAPDTLLLAEAFWLMEGYFVRTLGMHRVYNSAFMHMLKNEENQKYRYTIKNTIEFEPEILKRYVNFMNNPDEETAINQFGDGDKYFGVCVMMSTMPGLPMFGHGQVEGFHEKYGMEYRRAYYDEQPSAYLIERHRREVFPLLKKRYLFAEVDKFLLYDFFNTDGSVNENVFAFSNRFKNERALVVFHNAYDDARGWIRTSAAFTEKDARSGERRLVQKAIGEGLALDPSPQAFSIMRDHVTGLEYLYHNQTLMHRGMYMELGAYKYHVFIDFRQVSDHDGHYARLNAYLNGRGVPSVEESLREMHLQPLHQAFRVIFNVRSL